MNIYSTSNKRCSFNSNEKLTQKETLGSTESTLIYMVNKFRKGLNDVETQNPQRHNNYHLSSKSVDKQPYKRLLGSVVKVAMKVSTNLRYD